MRLSDALRVAGDAGEPLPNFWPSLRQRGVEMRRGELFSVAASSGAGKSTFALSTVMRLGRPTLFFSADTAAYTAAVRLGAMLSDTTQETVADYMATVPGWSEQWLERSNHISWDFHGAPDLDHIDLEVRAYEEMHGSYPEVIVIDNLADVTDGDEEWAAMRAVNKELKFLARDIGAAVLVLQHTNEGENATEGAPSRGRVQGKDLRMAAVFLTLGQVEDGTWMALGVVKNRNGKPDPGARSPVYLAFDGDRMSIRDPLEVAA